MTLRLERVLARTFADESVSARDPALRGFIDDLVRPYGVAARPDVFAAAAGHSYGEMAEELVGAVVTAQAPIDVLILAHAMPDVIPGRATATYLSAVCPGTPYAFAICDQGLASPYTALVAASGYLPAAADRVLVLVAEQSALHHDLVGPGHVPGGHHAVALLLSGGVGRELTPLVWPGVGPHEAASLLAAEVGADDRVVLGASLAAALGATPGLDRLAAAAVVASADRPLTGVWSTLAESVPGADRPGVLIAEYDAGLGYLCLARLRGED